MYSLLLPNNKEKSTAKGIKKSFAKKNIKHQQYRDCLFNETETSATFQNIRSFNHEVHTVSVNKSALSPYDDKRYLQKGKTDTLAYGHYSIKY